MRILSVFSLLFMLLVAAKKPVPHNFYVSITELNIIGDTIQISIRLFSDDLENALKNNSGITYNLEKASEYDRNQNSILRYIDGKFDIGSATKSATIKWLGYEYEQDVTWLYGEAVIPADSRMVFVKNLILADIHEKQQNMIHLKTDDGFETDVCSKQKSQVRFIIAK